MNVDICYKNVESAIIYSNQCKMANVQTTFSFWRTTQDLFILALLCSLITKHKA